MATNWNWFRDWLVPEILLFEETTERKRVFKRAYQSFRASFIVGMIALFLGCVVIKNLVVRVFQLGEVADAATFAVLIFGVTFLLPRLYRRQIRRYVRRELNSRGIRVCMACAYQLEGLTEPRCPECGQPFEIADRSSPNTPDNVASPPK